MPSLGKGTHAFRPSDQTRGASSAVSTMPPEPISDEETPVTLNQPPINHSSVTTSSPRAPLTQPPINRSSMPPPPGPPPSSPPPPSSEPPQSVGSGPRSSSQQIESATTGSLSTGSHSKRKYSALDASLSGSVVSGKKQRSTVSGAVTLNGIKESLDMFNKTIDRSLVQPQSQARIHDTSPEHRAKAMARVQAIETHLDDMRMIALIDLFKADTTEADAYMSLQRDTLRKKWLEKQLVERCGFPADISDHSE